MIVYLDGGSLVKHTLAVHQKPNKLYTHLGAPQKYAKCRREEMKGTRVGPADAHDQWDLRGCLSHCHHVHATTNIPASPTGHLRGPSILGAFHLFHLPHTLVSSTLFKPHVGAHRDHRAAAAAAADRPDALSGRTPCAAG